MFLSSEDRKRKSLKYTPKNIDDYQFTIVKIHKRPVFIRSSMVMKQIQTGSQSLLFQPNADTVRSKSQKKCVRFNPEPIMIDEK